MLKIVTIVIVHLNKLYSFVDDYITLFCGGGGGGRYFINNSPTM